MNRTDTTPRSTINVDLMVTVIEKKNGDKSICIPVDGIQNVATVTLQKDGEIRWASVGPLKPEQAIHFSNALRLAIYLSQDQKPVWETFGNVGSGLSWETKAEN